MILFLCHFRQGLKNTSLGLFGLFILQIEKWVGRWIEIGIEIEIETEKEIEVHFHRVNSLFLGVVCATDGRNSTKQLCASVSLMPALTR